MTADAVAVAGDLAPAQCSARSCSLPARAARSCSPSTARRHRSRSASRAGRGSSLVLALALARYDAAVALGARPARDHRGRSSALGPRLRRRHGRRARERAVPPDRRAASGRGDPRHVRSAQRHGVDPGRRRGRAAVFFGCTLYLALFAIWLAGYVASPRGARLVVRAYLFAAVTRRCSGVLALLGAVPGRRPPDRERPCARLLPGPERLRAVPHPAGADPHRGARPPRLLRPGC